MSPLFHVRRTNVTKDTPRQEKWRHHSLLTTCNPFTWSNPFKRENISTTEKIGFSIKDEAHLSDFDHERGSTAPSGPVRAEPYHWPHDGRLEPATTALVIIDMQRDCTFVILHQYPNPASCLFTFGNFPSCYPRRVGQQDAHAYHFLACFSLVTFQHSLFQPLWCSS